MGACNALTRAVEEVMGAGDALVQCAGNEQQPESCRVEHGDVESSWVSVKTLGVSGFLLPTFLCRSKEK
jgi:hypothetical protein